jgi:peptidyl-prolyl cis-trans isomerase B (cyclophilin B)
MSVDQSKLAEVQSEIDFSKNSYELLLQTNHGDITLEFYPNLAPKHCLNMLGLAKLGFYDGLSFHRIVPGFVIQGGCPQGTGTGGPGFNVDAEFTDTPHEPGTLSMARAQDPNSAGSQFFLCLEKVPFLDNQYTVFGKTKDDSSLGVVTKIGAVKTGPGDRPEEPVTITKAVVSASAL